MPSVRLRDWTRPAGPVQPVEIALRLTLVELLLRPMGPWFVRAFMLLLAMLGLVSGRVLGAPVTWLTLTALVAARLVVDWPLPDNHVYLLAYWCLSAAIALGLADPSRALARSARLLIGLAFAFAVFWKAVLSPDYLDGRFFAVTLLTDDRFADAVMMFGGLNEQQLGDSREYLTPLPEGAELLDPRRLDLTPRFQVLVHTATWGGLALEAAISAFWLLPAARGWITIARHSTLLLFCLGTYAFAPVAGFGWLLLVMGMATCAVDAVRLRGFYVATFGIVLLYAEIPWTSLVMDSLGR
jgi:hypothetical protein